jgi:hypothetical protein
MDSSTLVIAAARTWPGVTLVLGLLLLAIILIAVVVSSVLEFRKTRLMAGHEDDLRQLVNRYEQLAEKTMDAQQRISADVSELRSRTASIEQILRTVE